MDAFSDTPSLRDVEILDGEIDLSELTVLNDESHLDTLRSLPMTFSPMGIYLNESLKVPIEELESHSLNLIEFSDAELVLVAHHLFLRNLECRDYEKELLSYIYAISKNYRANSFHNFTHAVTVLHCSSILLNDLGSNLISPMNKFGLMLSALVHDVNHPGHTNGFENITRSRLSILYEGKSVLERHHIAVSFFLMESPHSYLAGAFDRSVLLELKCLMKKCILATDMAQHTALVQAVDSKISIGIDYSSRDDQHLLCTLFVHAADLFNPVRPFKLAKIWATRISDEFNLQAKKETELGFPLQAHMVTNSDFGLAKNELFFSSTFVLPMWINLSTLYPEFKKYKELCLQNLKEWEDIAKGSSISADLTI